MTCFWYHWKALSIYFQDHILFFQLQRNNMIVLEDYWSYLNFFHAHFLSRSNCTHRDWLVCLFKWFISI